MEESWKSIHQGMRDGLLYLSAHFYPKRYMKKWSPLRALSEEKVKEVMKYSPQQFFEELNHFDFFRSYFGDQLLMEVELPGSYQSLFDSLMEDFKSDDWLFLVATRFQMVTEGILASVGLEIMNTASKELPVFNRGIREIIEDEARHVNFGLNLLSGREREAIERINQLYPLAKSIVEDGMERIRGMGFSDSEVISMLERAKSRRISALERQSKNQVI